MLSFIYDFLYENIWQPLDNSLGSPISYSLGGSTFSLGQTLTILSCVVIGVLFIVLMVLLVKKVFCWFFGLIGK